MNESIDVFIDKKIVVLKDSDTVLQAARAMCENQVGCVVVLNQASQVEGILTDRDVVCNTLSIALDSSLPLSQVIETEVVLLNEHAKVEDAIKIMKDYGIRRIPIIEETKRHHHKCIGIVTLDDLIAREYISIQDLSEIVKSQIRRRKKISRDSLKKDSHIEHTYNNFISEITEEIQFSKEQTEDLTMFLLGQIVQRLHYTGGTHLISQLPKKMHEPLLDLPAGPDRSITDHSIAQGISIRTGKDINSSRELAQSIWAVISDQIGEGEPRHVMDQLPQGMKDLFQGPYYQEADTMVNLKRSDEDQVWRE